MNHITNGRIFISYSRRANGPKWKAALLKALQVFEQQHLLDVWEDGKIRVSSFWNDDITQAMSQAQLAVVLLTKEALESEFIRRVELPFLRDRQKNDNLPVIPVICEECDEWKNHDWLRATQAPNNSKPLAPLSQAAQNRIFRELAHEIANKLSRVALEEVPKPDQPLESKHVYLDKFPLSRGSGLHEEKLIGREQELALLDLAFAQPGTAIVSLIAWGGVGKTMLVQHWLKRLEREGWFGARRVYAWSFYSQGTSEDRQASEDLFLADALKFFGVQCEPTLSPWDKGRLLADAVARERTLLILDGIEPLQYPPGPMGGQLRAPGVQSLLKQLAHKASALDSQPSTLNQALCLVTTREPLVDLVDFQRREGSAWGSVLHVALGDLTEEAGAALLHHAGAKRAGAAEIKSDDKELLAASNEVKGHALTLNLLGTFLHYAHEGNILRRAQVKFEEADRTKQGGTTFKMLTAFEDWFNRGSEIYKHQLAVLRMLGLFDRPADAGCIAALRNPPVIIGLTDPLFTTRLNASTGQITTQPLLEEDWNVAISFLAKFGLIVDQADADSTDRRLDCHPLIRERFSKRLRDGNPKAFRAAHKRLYQYICETTRDTRHPTIKDLEPLYQAVAHGCQAGLQQQTCEMVYLARINRGHEAYSARNLGALGSDLGAVSCFFETQWTRISPALTKAAQAWLFNEAAFRLGALGRLNESIFPMRAGLPIELKRKDWKNAAIRISNLSALELTLGEVDSAICDAEKAVSYADKSGEAIQRMGKRTTHADALHQAGHKRQAAECFREAEKFQALSDPDCPLLYSVYGFRYCDLLLGTSERAAWKKTLKSKSRTQQLVGRCKSVSDRAEQTLNWWATLFTNASLLDISLDQLTLSRAMFYMAILEGSDTSVVAASLQKPADGLRRAAQQQYFPLILLTNAWCFIAEASAQRFRSRGRKASELIAKSKLNLDEAWDIASRGPMRLHLADIHLYRARLFFREKTYPWKSPQDDLAAAEKLINDCGYHRRDEELADAKKAILGEP
jgi:hypothetical protein